MFQWWHFIFICYHRVLATTARERNMRISILWLREHRLRELSTPPGAGIWVQDVCSAPALWPRITQHRLPAGGRPVPQGPHPLCIFPARSHHPLLPALPAASPGTPTGSPLRLRRPSADTWAASTRRDRKTGPWTPSPSSRSFWSSGGSEMAVLACSNWRRCWWPWAAPASPPWSATCMTRWQIRWQISSAEEAVEMPLLSQSSVMSPTWFPFLSTSQVFS